MSKNFFFCYNLPTTFFIFCCFMGIMFERAVTMFPITQFGGGAPMINGGTGSIATVPSAAGWNPSPVAAGVDWHGTNVQDWRQKIAKFEREMRKYATPEMLAEASKSSSKSKGGKQKQTRRQLRPKQYSPVSAQSSSAPSPAQSPANSSAQSPAQSSASSHALSPAKLAEKAKEDDYTKARRPATAQQEMDEEDAKKLEVQITRILENVNNTPGASIEATALVEHNHLSMNLLMNSAPSLVFVWNNHELTGRRYEFECTIAAGTTDSNGLTLFNCQLDLDLKYPSTFVKDKKVSLFTVTNQDQSEYIHWLMNVDLSKCQLVGNRKYFLNTKQVGYCPVELNSDAQSLPRELDDYYGTY